MYIYTAHGAPNYKWLENSIELTAANQRYQQMQMPGQVRKKQLGQRFFGDPKMGKNLGKWGKTWEKPWEKWGEPGFSDASVRSSDWFMKEDVLRTNKA